MTNEIETIIPNAFTISSEKYYQLVAELEELIKLLETDTVARYRVTIEQTPHPKLRKKRKYKVPLTKRVPLTALISLREGRFPSEFNQRQARALMGVEHPILNAKGRVDARWALDKISRELGMGWEELVGRIEYIARVKKRIKELKVKLYSAVIDVETMDVPEDDMGEE